jgi:hypothetical protein
MRRVVRVQTSNTTGLGEVTAMAMTQVEIETMEAYLEYAKVESQERTREELEPSEAELKFRHMTGVWPSELAHI